MLTDWYHWLTSLTPTELVTILGILLFVDGSRYAVCTASMALFDLGRWCVNWLRKWQATRPSSRKRRPKSKD